MFVSLRYIFIGFLFLVLCAHWDGKAVVSAKKVDRKLASESDFQKFRRVIEANSVWQIEKLIASGADVKVRNQYGRTPLHWAARRNCVSIAPLLLEAGAEVDAKDKYFDRTPLHEATWRGYDTFVRLLLEADADVNARDKNEWTPLHLAVKYGRRPTINILLEFNADVNAINREGKQPIFYAEEKKMRDVVRLLTPLMEAN